MGCDPYGTWTMAFSVSINLNFFGEGIVLNFGIATSEDDFTFQFSYAAHDDTKTEIKQKGVNASIGVNLQYTDFESVEQLEGGMYNSGVSLPVGRFDILTSEKNEYAGWQIGFGPGVAADFHKTKTYTYNSDVWEPLNLTRRMAEWSGIR